MASLRQWVKTSPAPAARVARAMIRILRTARVPCVPPLHGALYRLNSAARSAAAQIMRAAWWTPMFMSRIETPARGIRLEGGMPAVLGSLRIRIGRDCRVSGVGTWSGRPSSSPTPLLQIGDDCDIGWSSTISVGSRVVIGDHVRLAGRVSLVGYPGHPLDPEARAAGLPCLDTQCGDIVIGDGAWLGAGVTVLAGVTIGEGSVIGTGSIVTKDIPARALAAGNPCRVIRMLDPAAGMPS